MLSYFILYIASQNLLSTVQNLANFRHAFIQLGVLSLHRCFNPVHSVALRKELPHYDLLIHPFHV